MVAQRARPIAHPARRRRAGRRGSPGVAALRKQLEHPREIPATFAGRAAIVRFSRREIADRAALRERGDGGAVGTRAAPSRDVAVAPLDVRARR